MEYSRCIRRIPWAAAEAIDEIFEDFVENVKCEETNRMKELLRSVRPGGDPCDRAGGRRPWDDRARRRESTRGRSLANGLGRGRRAGRPGMAGPVKLSRAVGVRDVYEAHYNSKNLGRSYFAPAPLAD
ncbi:hypothetical protein KIN20_020314 [Parelaphostrongylus tenuis]|uniref:Uncharacterized protein n=1 Tax=Parelaphostrongylus tenuis TaxID=148309 RepID=A0AAD5N6D2_PARTN|nr:hypothetical protein KIN20_020314 [Parelaphostrongylus tenuis]